MYNKRQNNINTSSAFTLIELMVATTIFTIIMLMGVGSLVVSSNAAKGAQKLRIAVDNVNFAIESMTRELRMGTNYYCGSSANLSVEEVADCISGGGVIAFTPQKLDGDTSFSRITYRMKVDTKSIERCEYKDSTTSCADIVSDNVEIKTLRFFVKGSDINDNIQPSARILVTASISIKEVVTSFSLQTIASQRSSEK